MKVLKNINKRILAIFLAVAMVVTGLYVFAPEAEKVQAAGSDTLFAGYYEDAELTIPCEVETPYEKSVDSGILSIKLQIKENTDSVDMRVISSVDSLDYKNVGFEVYYKDATEPIVFETTTVLERINASKTNVTYEYSPKVIDTASEYFVTGTLMGISKDNLDENFYIKPFWTTLDGTVVYGEGRFFTVADGVSDQNINIPVKMDTDPGTSVSVSVGGTNATATVAAYKDGYAHLNIPVENKTALKSATTITVGSDSVVYRNLLSTGDSDTSWYDEYKDVTSEFVIANKADLLGFVALSQSNNFASKKVYTISDIEINDTEKVNWTTGVAETGYTPSEWAGISSSSAKFAGTFDGQGHTISGLYLKKASGSEYGFFRYIAGGTIKNFKLIDSYFEIASAWANTGSVVGLGYGNLDRLYSNATVVSSGVFSGGIIGGVSTGGTYVTNCWFDGIVQMKGEKGGVAAGIIGGLQDWGSTIVYNEMSNCLNTGIISAEATGQVCSEGGQNPCVAGLVGLAYRETLTIKDSVNTGSVTTTGKTTTVGAIAGWSNGGTTETGFTVSNVYATTESCAYGVGEASNVTTLSESELQGQQGYLNTKLDFYRNDTKDGEWAVTETGTPVLRSFAKDTISLDGVLRAADTNWYDGSGSYVIDEPEELLGLVELSQSKNFAGETIKLGADISINDVAKIAWETGVAEEGYTPIQWTGISSSGAKFAGTFDGEGHTISGIYVTAAGAENGLFRYLAGGTIRNFKLTDSYFEHTGTWANTGSIVGLGYGNLDSLYSNATVVSSGVFSGGIIGGVTTNGTYVTNCWFDGIVQMKGEKGGVAAGIIGGLQDWSSTISYNEMSNCLNTGTISAEATGQVCSEGGQNPCVAGLVGLAYRETLTIKDSVNTGSVTTTGKTTTVGAIAGWSNGGTAETGFTVSNVYATTESCAYGVGEASNVARVPQSDLMYAYGYINTDLDFYDYETKTGYWTAVEDGTIALKSFAENKISTKDAIRNGDQSWYDGSGSYTISTPEQLVGFMELAKTNDFSGATITLGADIKMNDGDASTWGTKAPKNVWTPIGKTGDHSSYVTFAGTFDGDGYTISGIYVKSSSTQIGLFGNVNGATIKNLQLTNSYIENTTSAYDVWAGTGSIAGIAYAQLEAVYSDAIVVSGTDFVGGLLGGLLYNAETTITNSWFAGEVTLAGDNSIKGGGLVGGLTAGKCTLTNCLNSGTITSETVTYAPNIAGFVGYVSSRQVDMTNCLNVGTINPRGNTTSVGAIVGYQTGTSAVSNVYTLEGCYSTVGEMTGDNEALVGVLPLASLTGDAALTSLTGFDFYSESNTTGIWQTVDGGTPILAVFGK